MPWLDSFLHDQFVGHAARIDRQAVVVPHTAQFGGIFGRQIELEQAQHLRIAVLLDDVNAVVRGDELVDLAREWIRADTKVVRLDLVLGS